MLRLRSTPRPEVVALLHVEPRGHYPYLDSLVTAGIVVDASGQRFVDEGSLSDETTQVKTALNAIKTLSNVTLLEFMTEAFSIRAKSK